MNAVKVCEGEHREGAAKMNIVKSRLSAYFAWSGCDAGFRMIHKAIREEAEEGRKMRFIHMADVHLGAAPDAGQPWSGQRAREIWDTFRRALEDAGKRNVELLLIAGDLFHAQPQLRELEEVNYLFSGLSRTRIVLIAGNHDHLIPGGIYQEFPWSRNVVFLSSETCECVRFPEINTEVYGFSYGRQEITEPLYDALRPEKNGYLHILLAHGGDARHIPIRREALEQSGFDYIALGHIHKPQVIVPGKAAWSGALEPIDRLDLGPHGYLLGEMLGRRAELTFIPKARREYRDLRLTCGEEDTSWSLRERLAAAVEQNGREHTYRVTLEGSREDAACFDTELLKEAGRILEVEDKTALDLDLEMLRGRYAGSLIGRYIESFGEEQKSAVEQKALRYGLEALLSS